MKKLFVGGTARVRDLTEGEVAHFNTTREREGEGIVAELGQIVERAIPGNLGIWRRAFRVLVQPAGQACLELVKAVHPESPGGGKITQAELDAISKRLGDRVRRGFAREFADAIVEAA